MLEISIINHNSFDHFKFQMNFSKLNLKLYLFKINMNIKDCMLFEFQNLYFNMRSIMKSYI